MSKEHLCKLTTQDMTTHKGFQWELGEWHETSGKGDLCGPGWLHGYTHPLLAVLLNPVYGDIGNPRLFEIEIEGDRQDDNGLKFGATRMRLVKRVPLPDITPNQRVAFGLLCALKVFDDPDFVRCANGWVDGSNRSVQAAEDDTLYPPAARAAGKALKTTVIWPAEARAWAAEAADAAARVADIDLIALAQKAMEY